MKRTIGLLLLTVSLACLAGGCGGDGGPEGPAGLTGGKTGGDQPDGGPSTAEEPAPPGKEDPEAIAKLEELGASLEKNDAGKVTLVNLDGKEIRNSDLRYLEGTPFVETFSASNTALTRPGLGSGKPGARRCSTRRATAPLTWGEAMLVPHRSPWVSPASVESTMHPGATR